MGKAAAISWVPSRTRHASSATTPTGRACSSSTPTGAINVGGVNLYRDPPESPAEIRQAIGRLQRAGKIPDLTSGHGAAVKVWIGGLGRGLKDPLPVIRFWEALVPAAHGRLVSEDSTLRLVDFP